MIIKLSFKSLQKYSLIKTIHPKYFSNEPNVSVETNQEDITLHEPVLLEEVLENIVMDTPTFKVKRYIIQFFEIKHYIKNIKKLLNQ